MCKHLIFHFTRQHRCCLQCDDIMRLNAPGVDLQSCVNLTCPCMALWEVSWVPQMTSRFVHSYWPSCKTLLPALSRDWPCFHAKKADDALQQPAELLMDFLPSAHRTGEPLHHSIQRTPDTSASNNRFGIGSQGCQTFVTFPEATRQQGYCWNSKYKYI